jgi:hypothetical protein
MPRKRKFDAVNELHIQHIAHRAGQLRSELEAAANFVKPFSQHYDALIELRAATLRCEAILRGLPPDRFGESWNSTPGPAED